MCGFLRLFKRRSKAGQAKMGAATSHHCFRQNIFLFCCVLRYVGPSFSICRTPPRSHQTERQACDICGQVRGTGTELVPVQCTCRNPTCTEVENATSKITAIAR